MLRFPYSRSPRHFLTRSDSRLPIRSVVRHARCRPTFPKRGASAAFVSKLNDAEAEAAETQTHSELARRFGYLNDAEAARLDREYEEILAMLTDMASHPEQWTIRK